MWKATWVIIAFAMLAHCSFPPPTMPSDGARANDPSYASPSPTKSKINLLEQQVATAVSRMEEMQSQIDRLKGKSEVLGFEIQELRQQGQNQNQDLDARLREIESVQLADGIRTTPTQPLRPNTAFSSNAAESDSPPLANTDTPIPFGIETTIKKMFEEQSWDASIVQLEGWLKNREKHPKKADAMLALGQAHYEKKDYPRAIQALQSVVDEFAVSDQACQARYYQGQSFVGLKDSKNATLFFQETIELCPKNPAKEKAQKALQSINA